MKRSKQLIAKQVYIGHDGSKCDKCRHIRPGEPFVAEVHYGPSGPTTFNHVCHHCLRDAESTLLVWQKWPKAFVRKQIGEYWRLEWDPLVFSIKGESHEA